MKATYIYGIRDLELGLFIYIGKGNIPQSRFEDHINGRGNEGVWELVKERGRNNFQIETLEIVEFEVPRDWVKRERFWVKKFREEGHPLCNKNDGGGGSTAGYHHTEETKAKNSEAQTGSKSTRETRAKISKANTGKKRTKEAKAKNREAHLGQKHTEETKAKLSRINTGKNNPMYGKTGEDHPRYGTHHTEETLVKMRNAHVKPYPAFYNKATLEFIPKGKNLAKLCRELGLNWDTMRNLSWGASKCSQDGWIVIQE